MSVSKSYTYFKAAKYLDQMAVIMLVSVLAVDVLPTWIILVGAVVASIAYSMWVTNGRTKIDFGKDLDVLAKKRDVTAARFYVAPPESEDAYVDGYLGRPIVFVPYETLTGEPKRLRSILAHERAHASSADSLARFIYEHGAKYLLYTAVAWPLIAIYLTSTQGSFPWPLLALALLYSPYFYFAYTKKKFLYRREFFADLEAKRALGSEYENFLILARRRKRFTKGQSDEVGTDTHPALADRVSIVTGETDVPPMSIFLLGLLTSLSATFVFSALTLNVTYIPECNAVNPNCDQVSQFDLVTFALSSFVFFFWLSRYLKILRSVLLVGKNGFAPYDYMLFFSGLFLGWAPCSAILLLGYFGFDPSYGAVGLIISLAYYYVVALSFNLFLIICVGLSAIMDEVGVQHVLTPCLMALSLPFLYISTLDETFRILGAFTVLVDLAAIGALLELVSCFLRAMLRMLRGKPFYREQWA